MEQEPASLLGYRKNVYSQNGEDGVVGELVKRFELKTGWFCEFGAWDGQHGSNTFNLLRNGWRGVMIEGRPRRYRKLARTAAKYPDRLITRCAYVTSEPGPESLDGLLSDTPIPTDFELLSIDIDGPDWHVWNSLTTYTPKIVIIEINSSYLPGVSAVHGESQGSSFSATVELGRRKGYQAVCHTGNLFFVRDDLVDRLGDAWASLDRDVDAVFLRDWTVRRSLGRRIRGKARRAVQDAFSRSPAS